jgi:hypothetical protein
MTILAAVMICFLLGVAGGSGGSRGLSGDSATDAP